MSLKSIASQCQEGVALCSVLRVACEQQACQPLYLDESRRCFVRDFGMYVHYLLNDKLLGNNQSSKLLQGVVGVGKTEMLKALLRGLEQQQDDRLITLYVNLETTLELPSTLILKQYNQLFNEQVTAADLPHTDDCGNENAMRRTDSFLTQRGKYVVLVIDELQGAFDCPIAIVHDVFKELTAIGESCTGRVYCVISHSYLRRTDYSARPLDLTKYAPYTLRPMQNAEDIEGLRAKLLNINENLREVSTETLFATTAGVPGAYQQGLLPISLCVDEYFTREDWPSYSAERYILEKLYFCVLTTYRSDCPFDVVKPVSYVDFLEPIDYRMLQKRFDPCFDHNTISKAMDELKDRGVIVQEVEQLSIAFGAPSVFYTVSEHLPAFLCREILELRYPVSAPDNSLAVSMALRMLWVAANSNESILGMKLLTPANHVQKVNIVAGGKFEMRRIYKETSVDEDGLGADAFVIDDDRCTVTVCRIQANLSFGVISSRLKAWQVIDGFTRNGRLARAAESYRLLLGLAETTPVQQKLFVLTDKLIDGATKKALRTTGIHMINATDMPGWPRKLTGPTKELKMTE